MSVITISGGSHSYGKEVAEKLAQKLGYECLSRDVLIEASKEFNVPEVKLLRAIRDAPSILDRFTYGKERYIAYFQTALLEHFQKDNTVYHGLAGHFFVKSVAHVLKVRITADFRASLFGLALQLQFADHQLAQRGHEHYSFRVNQRTFA